MGEKAIARQPDMRVPTLRDMLERSKDRLGEVLPKHLTPERLVRITVALAARTPKLLDCSPGSILNCVMQAAQLGLEPGNVMGTCYFVPYGKESTLIVGYRGLIELARRSGQIDSIEAHVVHAKDKFSLKYGLEPELTHEPDLSGDPGAMVLAYSIARFKDGGKHVEVMTRSQIEKVRERSKSGQSGPWATDYEEMCRKTVVRRAAKYWPLSPEMVDAIEVDTRNEFEGAIDVTNYTAPPPPKAGAEKKAPAPEIPAAEEEPGTETAPADASGGAPVDDNPGAPTKYDLLWQALDDSTDDPSTRKVGADIEAAAVAGEITEPQKVALLARYIDKKAQSKKGANGAGARA